MRVIRTCRVMGVPTVAVYSDADRAARHVREADEAVAHRPGRGRRSYLSIDAIVGAARRAGADAVHPGYGFLSQNGDFADAVRDAGLMFVGPPGDVHRRMGDKRAARRLDGRRGGPRAARLRRRRPAGRDARRRGAPHRLAGDAEALARRRRQGHAGGAAGGATSPRRSRPRAARQAAPSATTRWCSSASSTRPRHVEVQVIADAHGRVLHLGERECSVQRRHQKVVEETPSPALDDDGATGRCARRASPRPAPRAT